MSDGLADEVGRALTATTGRPRTVMSLRSERSPFAGVWPAETLAGVLEDGESFSLWLKRRPAGPVVHPDKDLPDREVLVYRRLLGGGGLPVPRLYGADRDPRTGETRLYLEHVPDWDLRYHGLDVWEVAVRALARLHRHFAARPAEVEACPFLVQVDRCYVEAWSHRAVDAVGAAHPGLARRLAAVLGERQWAADILASARRTLIHNDLAPKNVVAHTAFTPPRIFFVDWEVAGFGCPALDLVHLAFGLSESDERRLIDAYVSESPEVLPEGDELVRVLAAARAHKAVFRLAHPHLWERRSGVARAWVAEVEESASVL